MIRGIGAEREREKEKRDRGREGKEDIFAPLSPRAERLKWSVYGEESMIPSRQAFGSPNYG